LYKLVRIASIVRFLRLPNTELLKADFSPFITAIKSFIFICLKKSKKLEIKRLHFTKRNSRNSLWFVKTGGVGNDGPNGGTDCSL
jgi:hypothetical protein